MSACDPKFAMHDLLVLQVNIRVLKRSIIPMKPHDYEYVKSIKILLLL